jgi:dTDP-4-amino-4,6-dideoxygalactose transaminase
LPVHVYGNVCNLKAIEDISKKHNIPVIYDSAHAFGVKYKSVPISAYGDFNMFSFHATKVFHTVEGGALTYKASAFKEPLEANKNFGISTNGDVLYAGGNAKMNEFQAVIGLANLSKIHKYIKRRISKK